MSMALPPAEFGSSKSEMAPTRPGFGVKGEKTTVRANHFLVELDDRDLYHYDVSITPEVKSKKTNRKVMDELARCHRDSFTDLGRRQPVYDGKKSLYTAGALLYSTAKFVVKLPASSSGREKEFVVTIKLASKPDFNNHLQALGVVLRVGRPEKYITIGRFFFDSNDRKGKVDNGVEYSRGFCQSLRLTQMGISLNIDVSAQPFYEPIALDDFIKNYLDIKDFSRPLDDTDLDKVNEALKSLKVELMYGPYAKSCRISSITRCPISQLSFTPDNMRSKMSVIQHFLGTHSYKIKYPSLPAVQSGSDSKPVYYPMEVCHPI